MQKEMPVGGYKWCTEITLSEILSTPADSAFGCFVEVDLAYPAEVHDVHDDMPLAPEESKIPTEWRSDYANAFGLIVGSSTEKLVARQNAHLPLRKPKILSQAGPKS